MPNDLKVASTVYIFFFYFSILPCLQENKHIGDGRFSLLSICALSFVQCFDTDGLAIWMALGSKSLLQLSSGGLFWWIWPYLE